MEKESNQSKETKILFVCHGNICRSPMAEFVMKKLAADAGRDDLVIESAALYTDEIGNDRAIADPWYTGNFNATYDDVLAGCQGLLARLRPLGRLCHTRLRNRDQRSGGVRSRASVGSMSA